MTDRNRYAPLTDRAKARLAGREPLVAKCVGVHVCTVHKWRLGKTVPSYEHAALAAASLDGLTLEDLGYTVRADGHPSRLLAPGYAPAPAIFIRAEGRCVGNVCGSYYRDHPVPIVRGGCSFTHVLCDGRRVKL